MILGQRSVRSWSRRRTPPPSHHRWPPKGLVHHKICHYLFCREVYHNNIGWFASFKTLYM